LQKSPAPWPAGRISAIKTQAKILNWRKPSKTAKRKAASKSSTDCGSRLALKSTSIAGGEWTQAIASAAPATGKTNAAIEPRNSGYPTWIRKKPEPTLDVSATMAYIEA
jgi:hypothetical protein